MKFNEKEVQYSITVLPEDIPVHGNALVSGNDSEDKKAEDAIIEDLNNGNEWAWCTVRVTASWNGIKGTNYLGACSYRDESDFKQTGGYYEDMKAEALEDLKNTIREMQKKVCNVEVA